MRRESIGESRGSRGARYKRLAAAIEGRSARGRDGDKSGAGAYTGVVHTPKEAQVDQQPTPAALAGTAGAPLASPTQTNLATITIYLIAFVTGAIVMSFEMLGSRYLNPYFGSGIYTWAALISTVLTALTAGYFLGGWLADRTASATVLGAIVLVASAYLVALPGFSDAILDFVLADVDDVRFGSLLASFAILFFPVTLLGVFSPFAIRLMLRSPQRSGVVSGTVYGVSTAGSIVGTLGTTFFLIPLIGTKAITHWLGAAGVLCGLLLLALPRLERRRPRALMLALVTACAGLALSATIGSAENLIDEAVRAAMLKQPDGRIAHIESEYNDIFINKRRGELTMSFQLKGWDYTESVTNLRDPDDLPLRYSQVMTAATIYPQEPKNILMIGLGGGSISTYLGRFMPEAAIDTVEIDRRVIESAKKYFGLRDSERVRYLDGDGRVFLNRSKDLYDLILVDAYHGGYVPFHLLTKEFYSLVKQRLTPGGAAAFNVHDGTKLYASTVKTLGDVFPTLDLYPSGLGETIVVVSANPAPNQDALASRAAALQERYNFRFPLPQLVQRRVDKPQSHATGGVLITDDFAPVNLYDTIGKERPKKK
jgi:spermidine synthase